MTSEKRINYMERFVRRNELDIENVMCRLRRIEYIVSTIVGDLDAIATVRTHIKQQDID